MTKYTDDFFVCNRWILKLAGLWSPDTNRGYTKKFYKVYAIMIFLFVNLWFTFTEFVSLFYTFHDEDAFIKNINFFLTHFMGAVKVIFWYFRGSSLLKIVTALEDTRLHYKSSPNFSPGSIYNHHKKLGMTYTFLFLGLAHATLISSYIPPIVTVLKCMKNDTLQLPKILPYYSWMPFDYNSAQRYLLALAYQAGPMFSYAYSVVGVDSFYMNILNCIGAHLSVIQNAFLKIHVVCAQDVKPHDPQAMMLRAFKKVSRHLQAIYRISKYLESLYRYVAFCQVGATLFILCTCLYLVSTTPPGSKQFFAEIVYMTAMFFQLFVYCWFGNEVTIKSNELPYYIWCADWLSASNEFKKYMILTMARSKKAVYLTAGNFMPLTLATFMSIIKTSYSIFALIKNTNNNKQATSY